MFFYGFFLSREGRSHVHGALRSLFTILSLTIVNIDVILGFLKDILYAYVLGVFFGGFWGLGLHVLHSQEHIRPYLFNKVIFALRIGEKFGFVFKHIE